MDKSKATPLKIAAPKPPAPVIGPDEMPLQSDEIKHKGLEDKRN